MNHAKKLGVLQGLKKLCQGAVAFGFITSAGGNVLHAVETSGGRAIGFVIISVVLAILIPTIFGIMFEISTRVIFRREAHLVMKLIAFSGAAAISGITAWNSYFHQRDAFAHFGDATQAFLLPLAIDGLMIIGSVYLIELGFQVRDMEAFIAAGGIQKKVKEDRPVPAVKEKAPSKRDKIIQVYAAAPELPIGDIAKAAGTSYNYTHSVLKELKQVTEPVAV